MLKTKTTSTLVVNRVINIIDFLDRIFTKILTYSFSFPSSKSNLLFNISAIYISCFF